MVPRPPIYVSLVHGAYKEAYPDDYSDVCRVLKIDTKPMTKYLGVMIENKMSFGEQIRLTADNAASAIRATVAC